MSTLQDIYQIPLGLLTDLYQLSMAAGYEESGFANHRAVFHLYFRNTPFRGGYALSCGLKSALEYLENFQFSSEDVSYLATLKGNDERPLFSIRFLEGLKNLKLKLNVDAIEEGRVVFAGEPLLRVEGSLIECQLVETALLNFLNFQTLIATKAARVKQAAGDDPVLEFGLRRAQGIDGSISASRAAYVGGVDATSNVLAGRLFDIPVKGTHAHSWVMSFEDEAESFMAFAKAMPNNAVFLVDTYDTLEGVKNACLAGEWLKQNGHKMIGIRLDSGDLAYLSVEARKLLDMAGFKDAAILASNDLDENLIDDLKKQGAKIGVWGVGTKLVTAFDQPALGGVYKLAALRESSQAPWRYKIKISEQRHKTTTPGIHQVRRFRDAHGLMVGDMIFDQKMLSSSEREWVMVDPLDSTRRRKFEDSMLFEDLLKPVMREGKVLREAFKDSIHEIRKRASDELRSLHPSVRRFMNPHTYPVGLESGLADLKTKMILDHRGHE